jgi:hypothetical protein
MTAGTVFHIIAKVQERLGVAARRRFDVAREHGEHCRRLDPVRDGGRFGVGRERDWIAANRDYAQRPRTADGPGLPEIDHSANGLVIIGRRNAITDDDRRRLKSVTFNERIGVHSYDWLIEEAGKRIGYTAELPQDHLVECADCNVPGRAL